MRYAKPLVAVLAALAAGGAAGSSTSRFITANARPKIRMMPARTLTGVRRGLGAMTGEREVVIITGSSGLIGAGLQAGDRVACAGAGYASHAEVIFVPWSLPAPAGSRNRVSARLIRR